MARMLFTNVCCPPVNAIYAMQLTKRHYIN
jgi:hypothetical protein